MENYTLEQLKYFEFCFHKYSSKPTTNLNVISCNFIIVGAIFMKFSPKCNKNSDIGKFVKFGNFCLYLGKIGADYRPQIWPRKIPYMGREFFILLYVWLYFCLQKIVCRYFFCLTFMLRFKSIKK